MGNWTILLNPPPMIRIKHFSKKIRLQAMMIIHLKQKTWQVKTSWNNQFFQSMWHSSHSNFEIEILKPVLFLRTPPARFFSTLPMSFFKFQRIWQPKNMSSFKVIEPAQLTKKKVQKRSFVNLDHHQPSEIWGTKWLNLWKHHLCPPLKSRHTLSEV